MTKLDKPLRREVEIDGTAYTLTIDPEGLKLTQKGHRKGTEVSWKEILRGDQGGATSGFGH